MIVRDTLGNSKVISDRHLSEVRGYGISDTSLGSREESISDDRFEEIIKQKPQKKLGGLGSVQESFSFFGKSHDDTTLTYEQRKKLRALIRENPYAFVYVFDTPREALYSPTPYPIIRTEQQTTDDGVNAIMDWRELFEARPEQATLEQLSVWAAQYARNYGEVLGEYQNIHYKYLNVLGYPDDTMVGRIRLISPLLLDDVGHENGELTTLHILDSQGIVQEYKGKQLERFFFFTNMPDNEFRGMPRLHSLRRWLEGWDDLLEIMLDLHYNDSRPIEHHILEEAGMLDDDIVDMWNEHETNIKNTAKKQQRALMTNERIKIQLLGSQGRALDSQSILQQTKNYILQGLQRPESLIEAKNANKATADMQLHHYRESQLKAIDRAVALRLLTRNIFPKVLRTRHMDVRLTPTVKFPEFVPPSQLEQAIVWREQGETFGQSRVAQIATEQGFDYDIDATIEKSDGAKALNYHQKSVMEA